MDKFQLEQIRQRLENVKKKFLKHQNTDLHLLLLHDIPKLLDHISLDKMKQFSNGDPID